MSSSKQPGILRGVIKAYNQQVTAGWKFSVPIFLSVITGSILVFYVPPLVIARIIANPDTITLSNGWGYLLLFAGSWLGGEMLWRFAFFLIAKFETNTLRSLYHKVLDELLYKDIAFFNDRFAGSITKNVLAYARRFETYFDTLTFGIVSAIGPAIFGLVVLTAISPLLSGTLFIMIIIAIVLVRPLILRRSKLVHRREQLHASMSGHISDVISNIAAVRAHGAEKRELSQHRHNTDMFASAAYKSWQYHNTRIDMLISPFYVGVNALGLAIILFLEVDAAAKANMFIAFSYFLNISRFMWEFNGIYRRLEDALTDAALFIDYTRVEPNVKDSNNAQKLTVTSGDIAISDMYFSHQEAGYDGLFEDFSLTIKPGQRVGVVGHSGSGKSTLVNLLLRFIDVDSGHIRIDGQNVVNVTQESLHQSIAFVPQEPSLFHRSLYDNIAYGRDDATKSDVVAAAKRAHAYDFITELPEGLNTLVGERGVKLSGGQRQRIAIARAILKDAPILVLDEATSALDSESEKLIQESLNELMQGRTSIVVAHRLSTIAKLDRIIVLDNGMIVEDGPHQELIKHDGVYARLWNHQSGGFIEA